MACCLIFGGSKGIGYAIAQNLSSNGCRIAIASRNIENVHKSVEKLSIGKDNVLGLKCDVTDENDVKKTVQEVHRHMGRIDVLVNSAGINRDALVVKTKRDDIIEQINTNLLGTMFTCKAVLRHMIKQRNGCIINIGSVLGNKGNIGQSVYSASKAGIEGFTKSLAKEVASRGITANVIAPGFIRSDMTVNEALEGKIPLENIPLQRMGEPAEVAELAAYLINAKYITGQVLYIDGGISMNS